MNFILIKKNFLDISKIFVLSLTIFFWDLRIVGFDSRLLIITLIIFIFFEPSVIFSQKFKKNFIISILVFFPIAIHYYANLIIDNKVILKIPKELIYIYLCFFIIFINIELILKRFRLIIFFFITLFIIFTIIFFFKNGYLVYDELMDEFIAREVSTVPNSPFFIYKFNLSCSYFGGWHGYTRFFFSENSHLAMMSVPIIIYYLIGNHLSKFSLLEKISILVFSIIAVINYTATFLIGIIFSLLALFISNRKYFVKKKLIFTALLFFLSGSVIFIDKDCSYKIFKFQNAITTELGLTKWKGQSQDVINPKTGKKIEEKMLGLSGAVVMNSYNIALTTIKHRPLGWGVNRYKEAYGEYVLDRNQRINRQDPNYINKYNLRQYHKMQFVYNLNARDGANNLAKIITEFGIFSILIFIYFIYFSFSNKPSFAEKSFLIPLVLTQLLRGAGYFNGGFLIIIIIMLAITFLKKDD